MALLKTKNLNNGFTCEYWRVLEVNINFSEKKSHVTLGGYKDKAARDVGATPVDFLGYSFDDKEFPFDVKVLDTTNPIKVAYLEVKKSKMSDGEELVETNFLADAKDI